MLDGMIGALVLSAFALAAGPEEPLWVSSAPAIAGTTYRALSWSGGGGLDCTGVVAGTPAFAGTVRYEGTTGICLLLLPTSAAGKKLRIMYGVTTSEVRGQETVTHGSVMPRLVAPAPVPRAGRPFLVFLHPAADELYCEGGSIDGKRVPIRYERGVGTVACVLLIPKGTAGKWLLLNHSYRITTEPRLSGNDADGRPIYSGSTLWADGSTTRRLIRPAATRALVDLSR
jgi:hypothetical protein